ncbi:MAG TPA: hypothetical protein VK853_04425 [Ilumatobacteraceae bacterium]|nr:hypothetical protein [Ilumatobacteraceae bacterium]
MFERFVAVDWSASATPKRGRDSVWIAATDAEVVDAWNPPTRAVAEAALVDLLENDPDRSTLIGVDFSLGYPAGTAQALGFDSTAWRSTARLIADLVVDDERNANNRFEVAAELNRRITGGPAPFWGCPPSASAPTLSPTKPAAGGRLPQWRMVETMLRSQGRRPFSSWQLLGAGAVGGQSLLGIPMVLRLADRYGPRLQVWPFTTGLCAPVTGSGTVVVAEMWPSLLGEPPMDGFVRDEFQVRSLVGWLAAADAAGRLGDLFAPAVSAPARRLVETEEGWVLGAVV